MKARVILLHPDAPPKPAPGQACNGCGVCCMAQPCPIGMVASRRLKGPCALLQWHAQTQQYRCGALPSAVTAPDTTPTTGWRAVARHWQNNVASRWISAGSGCDCTLETADPQAL